MSAIQDRIARMALAARPFVGWRAVELVNNICTSLVIDDTWDRGTVYDTALQAVRQRQRYADTYGWRDTPLRRCINADRFAHELARAIAGAVS